MRNAGSWSAYWYNGAIFSSEIGRGLDVAELTPSQFISQNEIDAAKTVRFEYLNAQNQTKLVWPPSFALARSYVDQLERSKCVPADRISTVRQTLSRAEAASGSARRDALAQAGTQLGATSACDGSKVQKFQDALKDLGGLMP